MDDLLLLPISRLLLLSRRPQIPIRHIGCGIMFRANPALGSFYDFLIGQDGSYALYRYDSDGSPAKTLSKLSSSAIHTGLNQVNVIAVVASGGTLHLYVNH